MNQPQPLVNNSTVLLALVAAAMFLSNPDEAHFRRTELRQITRQEPSIQQVTNRFGEATAVERIEVERINFGLFCVVSVYLEERIVAWRIGLLGTWFNLS